MAAPSAPAVHWLLLRRGRLVFPAVWRARAAGRAQRCGGGRWRLAPRCFVRLFGLVAHTLALSLSLTCARSVQLTIAFGPSSVLSHCDTIDPPIPVHCANRPPLYPPTPVCPLPPSLAPPGDTRRPLQHGGRRTESLYAYCSCTCTIVVCEETRSSSALPVPRFVCLRVSVTKRRAYLHIVTVSAAFG